MEFLNALFTAAFDNNLVFSQVIAMVSVILVAERPQDAFRFGALLGIAVAVSGIVGWPLYAGYLTPWGVDYLAPLGCILASTGAIFLGGTLVGLGRPSDERTRILRTCTILACNAAVLAVPLSSGALAATMTFTTALGTSLGSGLGVALAVVLFAFVRDRVDDTLAPHVLRGLPLSLITASLMALAFTGVAGIAGGLFV
ncbi:MAG: Rnf-Nqr domain containing protein [Collinsella sp.]|nr:Rnf-Nqr domain containing protein [Collinsella sp.]